MWIITQAIPIINEHLNKLYLGLRWDNGKENFYCFYPVDAFPKTLAEYDAFRPPGSAASEAIYIQTKTKPQAHELNTHNFFQPKKPSDSDVSHLESCAGAINKLSDQRLVRVPLKNDSQYLKGQQTTEVCYSSQHGM